MQNIELNRVWKPILNSVLPIAIAFSVIFAAMRGIGMLASPSYRMALPVGFMMMILLPFIFLDKKSRTAVGFQKTEIKFYGWGIGLGLLTACLCYVTGVWLFDITADNWFVTIRQSYYNTMDTSQMSTEQLFITFTLPAVLFSPFGEEIFFRGFLQESLATKLNYRTSMIMDSALFAAIHIFHHGLIRQGSTEIIFLPFSGMLWVGLMFITAYSFAWLKRECHSLYPVILAHAVFNLAMNGFIFYLL